MIKEWRPKIEDFLIDKYQGKSKKYVEIIEENIAETPYLESEFRKAIKELEKALKEELLKRLEGL